MNEQIGVSGCFGNAGTAYPIDDINDAAAAVEEIVETSPEATTGQGNAVNLELVQLVGQYARRVQLLTWAVVAIVVVLVLKEVNE